MIKMIKIWGNENFFFFQLLLWTSCIQSQNCLFKVYAMNESNQTRASCLEIVHLFQDQRNTIQSRRYTR
jgi:hypothetical protein